MTPAELIFKKALAEKLDGFRKSAFVPMDPQSQQQAAGPGGMPVPDPAAAGAAGAGMPPGGGAPMDPMAAMGGGMPPGGGAPMDPMAAGGAPPADPMAAMGGAPPPADPAAGAMPPPDMGAAPTGGEGVTPQDVDTVDKITQRTLDTVHQALSMVGKAKTKQQLENDAQLQMQDAAMKAQEMASKPPETVPGPVTGAPMPADALQASGAPKTAAALKKAFSVTPEMAGAGVGALGAGTLAAILSKKNKARNALLAALAGGGVGYGAGALLKDGPHLSTSDIIGR